MKIEERVLEILNMAIVGFLKLNSRLLWIDRFISSGQFRSAQYVSNISTGGKMMFKLRKNSLIQKGRRGIAAVEFAVVAPLITLIFIGGISSIQLISLKHQATLIASSAGISAMKPEKSFAVVEAEAESFAKAAGLKNVEVDVRRTDHEIVAIDVSMPVKENFFLNSGFLPERIGNRLFTFRSVDFVD